MWIKVGRSEWQLETVLCPEKYRVYAYRSGEFEYKFRFVGSGKMFTSRESWKTANTAKKYGQELAENVKELYG